VPGMNGRIFPRELLNNILLMFSWSCLIMFHQHDQHGDGN
jgi:hypothetical protein